MPHPNHDLSASPHPRAQVSTAPGVASWRALRRAGALTLVLLALVLAWDATGWDLPLAAWMGGSHQFEWHHNRLLVLVFHETPRAISMVLVAALVLGVVWPWGFLQRIGRLDRLQLALSILGGIALTTLVKRLSATSCPWELLQFGGAVPYVSHWAWGIFDSGPGHCFPAGHASAAFGFMGAWFVLRRAAPGLAGPWLVAAALLGLVLGLAQQMRGAHYMSHTLWTAWICWMVGWAGECFRTACSSWRANGSQSPALASPPDSLKPGRAS